MRNLTKTLAVVSILAPASAHPLGIGDIKLLSALNQNLNAEIALVLSGEKPSDIQVHLAPPDKFNEAGVPWSYFLSKIKFETIVQSNGSVIIKLTSSEALKEPFLDLLLEVSWPKGNLYREFTVLVDPPAVYKEATIPVSTSTESYPSQEQYTTPQRRTPARKPQTHFATSGEYGPTRRNDTLWKVAEQARPDDDISVEQMMIALYEENPRAFYQQNVNALSAGKTLKVPEREAILKLSRKQALAEFNRQTKAWRNHVAPASVESVALNKEGLENQLTLAAPAEAAINETAVIAPGNEQVSAGNEKSSSSATGVSQANDAIQSKIAALEKQLAAMQQIITLKDQQLAELQNQPQAKPSVQDQPAKPEPLVKDEPSAQLAPLKPETTTQEQAIKPEPAIQSKPIESTSSIAQEQPVKPTPSSTKAVKPITQAKSAAQPVVQPKAESSSDLYYPIVGGIGATMLSILGWLWWRKRKVEEEMNTESMFASSLMSKAFGSGSGIENDSAINNLNSSVTESSFLSEFSTTDFGSFDIDQSEIDPLSEADVYLAYGRYHQAEELIQHAIKDFPTRDDCKLKLLEIFHATENKTAFESYAKELAGARKNNDLQFWEKVSEMASDICPGSSLFDTETINFGKDLDSSSDHSAVILDKRNTTKDDEEKRDVTNFAIASHSIKPDANQESAIAENSVLDFDLTSFTTTDDIVTDNQKNNSSIDFDLDTFASDDTTINEAEARINLDHDRVVDFEFDSLAKATTKDSSSDTQKPIESIDFDIRSTDTLVTLDKKALDADTDLEEFDFSFHDASDAHKKENNLSDDDFQFDFDLPLDQSNIENDDLGVSDLTDMDELETKLDLARAYIDMGDEDSAKDIVKEVLEKGTVEQQKIAQLLMVDLK